uniref:Methyltransferase-like protein n=2 Tax=Saccharopolyspora spinosa TaxID=60894 RepID=Q9ALM7_SACSN|nr:methyltransferase-like protein [Saccharopolyspora spinosa]
MLPGGAPTSQQVGQMYDLVTPLLNSVAGGPCAIHHGYWENDGRASWQQAADRLTDLVAERTVLDGGVRLLDVGCGTGQPALRVARDNAIQITGITVSQVQVAIAADCARERGLSHRVDFSCVDAMSLPYPDNAFDAAWAMQSLLEMSEPDRAIREILRVLKPGGILGVTEVVKREAGGGMPVSGDRWPTGLRICLAEQLLESLRAAGFEILDWEDVSSRTRYFMPQFAEELAAHQHGIADRYGPAVAGWAAAVCDYEKYAHDMGYAILTARKPVG